MKTEKECMAASASSSDTFDMIDSKDLEPNLNVSKDNTVVAENDAKTNAVDCAEIVTTSITNAPKNGDIDNASKDICKPCPSPCYLSRVNEDEDDDCSCTTTGSRSPTPVHFEITAKGVKVISDRESFL